MINKNKSLGVVSSGGGLRTYYNAGMFYMLKKHEQPVKRITAASGGAIAGALPFLAARTPDDIEEAVEMLIDRQNFSPLQRGLFSPSMFNLSGGYLVEMDKNFIEDELFSFSKRETFFENIKKIQLDISVTMVGEKLATNMIDFNALIKNEDYDSALDILYATSTTIPLTKAPKIDGMYMIDGGYTRNSPLKSLFMDSKVEEIMLVDFTHYEKYGQTIDKCYSPNPFRFFDNFTEMLEISMQISFDACNHTQLEHALFLNDLISKMDGQSLKVNDEEYVYKKIHTLEPKNLEMNPMHHNARQLARDYYELGKVETEKLLKEK